MREMSQEALAKWFTGFCCLLGKLDRDYWLMETDLDWWSVYLWIKRN